MFVNLHNHSEFSALDGLSKVDEIVSIAKNLGQSAVAITDHGVCASHPILQAECDKAGIKPIFGLEAYFVNDRLERPESGDKENQIRLKNDYYHLCLWAMDDEGLKNLWAMSTAAYREGYYYRPRLDWEILERLNKGVIASTACLRGPVSVPILNDDMDLAVNNLSRLSNIFGDRLYIELHTNQLEDQVKVNNELVSLSTLYRVPLIAAVDSHYPHKEDYDLHKIWIAMQTNSDLQDETSLYNGGQNYHMASEIEVAQALFRYGDGVVTNAIRNTVKLADRCTARISGETDPPIFSRATPKMAHLNKEGLKAALIREDIDRLLNICLGNWDRKVKGKSKPESEYQDRFEKEMKMYIDKQFCGYFDIVSDYSQWSKHRSRDGLGCIMGPSRGSGGACLVAYLADITEIDPIENDLPLARFMTMGRQEPPDFDLDWPATMRDDLIEYVIDRWGEQNVVRVGTHIRLKNKGAFQNVARVFKSTKPVDPKDLAAIAKIIDDEESDSAGLGKSWEIVYSANEDLFAPYKSKYPWLFEIAERFIGRLKSYGKHAAGLVISTSSPLVDRLPMRVGDDGRLISDFDFPALEALGLLKFDLLTLRTLDTLQDCVDRIYKNTGNLINIYDWKEEYNDERTWDNIAAAHTMGLFQVETSSVTSLAKRIKPRTMAELSAVITLVRPGPMRSGLTESYIRRKFGKEEVVLPDERLREALSETYGTIVYQEDIINTCLILAGYSEEEADSVRKILGKKKVAAVIEAGNKFIPACVANGMEEEKAQLLWSQMAEFAKYSFNKAHAYGYAVLCYWTAYFKTHYPLEFLAAALSTVDNDRIPDFVNEAHRLGFQILPPDINDSSEGFTTHEGVVRYGFEGVKGIGKAATAAILEGQPYTSFDDFMQRKGGGCHTDHIKMLAKIGAFDTLEQNRKALVEELEYQDSEDCGRCVDWTSVLNKYALPCNYDWDSEPVEFTKTGKPKKQKPIPKRCSKACRNYRPQSAPEFNNIDDYTAQEIRDIEMQILGVWLTSTPFDSMEQRDLDECLNAEQLESAPNGDHLVAGIVKKATERVDVNGNKYAWVSLYAQDSDFEIPCWSKNWVKGKKVLIPGNLVVCVVKKSIKNDRTNYSISLSMPV